MRRTTFTLLALAILAIVDMRPGITTVPGVRTIEVSSTAAFIATNSAG
jgi:hypothetical protein